MNNLYLTGLFGCGKKSVGRELARMAGVNFVDLETEAERAEGISVSAILESKGAQELKKREQEALIKASKGDWQVIACGPDTTLCRENAEIMQRTGAIVFLDTPPERIIMNLARSGHPMSGMDRKTLEKLRAERLDSYAGCCGVQMDRGFDSASDAAYELLKIFYPC